ncbi:hypothetical protein [Chitinophaga terrae (ex Kim and Jung 2007)]|nr:hypothetical protein [Chitinophaga terrae (ex Kim and Jung 2007)]
MMRIFQIQVFLLLLVASAIGQQPMKGLRADVAPAPNYSLTKSMSNVASLTDGKYTTGTMYWKDAGTLGWQNVNKITINITLPALTNIDFIKLNTVTGQKAQVNLPLSIMVFGSKDQQSWQQLGDMMDNNKVEDAYYNIISLTQQVDRSLRYLKLVVVPNGAYFFTDEISVFAKSNSARALQPDMSTDAIDTVVKSRRTAMIDRRFAAAPKGAAIAGGGSLTLSPLITAFSNPDQSGQQATVTTMVGLTTYATFNISNPTGKAQQIPVTLTDGGIGSTAVYWAKPVRSRDFKTVPDALMPIDNGQSLQLKPGESAVLVVKIKPSKSGNQQLKLKAGSMEQTVSLSVNPSSFSAYSKYAPDVNVWAYFNDPLLKDRPAAAQKDLLAHGATTFVFHPGILAPEKPLNQNSRLTDMLPMVKGFKQVLLFLNIPARKDDYWTPGNRQRFIAWYKSLVGALGQQGIASSNIYLYPVDEVKPAQGALYADFVKWVKSGVPDARFFATISDIKSLSLVQPLTDIVQVYNNNQLIAAAKSNQRPGQQIWLYDTKKPTKSLPPYSYYRLMGWKAFASGLTGFGFWQYADAGHDKGATSLWDDFDGQSADYNVVYDNGPAVISSRRWEAFKAGVDDYILLQAYAKKFGNGAALKICNEVLSNAGNPYTGEQARKNIISALEK